MDSSQDGESFPNWDLLPEHLLLHIFCYLSAQSVLNCSQMCTKWLRIAYDELLWKKLFYAEWNINRDVAMSPGKKSWMEEYKRLLYHTPSVESEVLKQHNDQVLHVSFSHDGSMFSTCSKDGYVKVWYSSNPVTLRYKYNMKNLTWKYTQFSQFNETNTLLLVSGVYFGEMSTSGEIAVFSLTDEFQLQCRVLNKPYDVFGTWYNSSYLLSGHLHWFGPVQSYCDIWLNKAFQATDSEHESVVMLMYRFKNINASSIRAIMIANCMTEDENHSSEDLTANNSTEDQAESSSEKDVDLNGKNPKNSVPLRVSSCTRASNCPNCNKRRADKISQQKATCTNGEQTKRSCKNLQCINLIQNRKLQNHMLAVSNDDVEDKNTIDSSEDYQNAEATRFDDLDSDISDTLVMNSSDSEECLCMSDCSGVLSNSNRCNSSTNNELFESKPLEEKLNNDKDSDKCSMPGCVRDPRSCSPAGVWIPKRNTNIRKNLRFSSATTSLKDIEEISKKASDSKENTKVHDKYLIFTTGSKTYTPHQIGIKKIHSLEAVHYENVEESEDGVRLLPNVEDNQPGSPHKFDEVDHLIELDGHIIGMCLSPDHRYLYVNSRPWPKNCSIENPLTPPPIAQEIDIHVIDLVHMKEMGTMHRSHKAYTPNDECFFIFLDVCDEFVASGAEDKFGYLWDRHYGVCLQKFPHKDVVNSVAFHPKNPEMLVTVSDDYTVKIWRSRHLEKLCKQERASNNKDQITPEFECNLTQTEQLNSEPH
ncbi:F-box/WD repeat-containing protein 5 [Octopus sinensis]|uniref:F-box/WD repeat-containing protein 5 n=1 Tax=Octopus sinensis TaxID=2607531 RepID=A0A6P7SBH3_9MOLL|nr:F-box/WD repeat-containing protein 5 [Octopus sinensis]XP_036358964.1 F-box/WD repeat-containing protein 5 [Octopus sinensis]XP_036358966.1 F-box/WD repeat-containing protein 5 [Octopus sinensis]